MAKTHSRIAILGVAGIVVVAVSTLFAQSSAAPEVLTNDSVIAMTTGKVPRDLILAKIDGTRNTFDITPEGLVGLYQGGVSDSVIEAVMKAGATTTHAKPLDNDGVIYMVTNKLSRDLIIERIGVTATAFDLTANGLVTLSQSKVSQSVVKAMMAAAAGPPAPAVTTTPMATASVPAPNPAPTKATTDTARQPAATATPAPAPSRASTPPAAADSSGRTAKAVVSTAKIPTEPGIYLYENEGGGTKFMLLEPTIYTAAKTGGMFKSAMTAGIAHVNLKASVRGAQATIATTDPSAEFYFVFENKQTQLGAGSIWATATSPNEFSLISFDVKSSTREVVVGQANAFGAQTGTQDKAIVDFKATKLAPGLYHVVPVAPLGEGQYAFMVGSAAGAAGGNRLFDFGVVR